MLSPRMQRQRENLFKPVSNIWSPGAPAVAMLSTLHSTRHNTCRRAQVTSPGSRYLAPMLLSHSSFYMGSHGSCNFPADMRSRVQLPVIPCSDTSALQHGTVLPRTMFTIRPEHDMYLV